MVIKTETTGSVLWKLFFSTLYFIITVVGAVSLGFATFVGWGLAFMSAVYFLNGIFYSWVLSKLKDSKGD